MPGIEQQRCSATYRHRIGSIQRDGLEAAVAVFTCCRAGAAVCRTGLNDVARPGTRAGGKTHPYRLVAGQGLRAGELKVGGKLDSNTIEAAGIDQAAHRGGGCTQQHCQQGQRNAGFDEGEAAHTRTGESTSSLAMTRTTLWQRKDWHWKDRRRTLRALECLHFKNRGRRIGLQDGGKSRCFCMSPYRGGWGPVRYGQG